MSHAVIYQKPNGTVKKWIFDSLEVATKHYNMVIDSMLCDDKPFTLSIEEVL